jgi:hypothetical protein
LTGRIVGHECCELLSGPASGKIMLRTSSALSVGALPPSRSTPGVCQRSHSEVAIVLQTHKISCCRSRSPNSRIVCIIRVALQVKIKSVVPGCAPEAVKQVFLTLVKVPKNRPKSAVDAEDERAFIQLLGINECDKDSRGRSASICVRAEAAPVWCSLCTADRENQRVEHPHNTFRTIKTR